MLPALLTMGLLLLLAACFSAFMSPQLKYHSTAYKLKAKLFFWMGDIRLLGCFPWVTWDSSEYKIGMRDVRIGGGACRPGYIGLSRHDGFLSNLGIPGAFKHAWIVIDNNDCVEATSDGVLKKDLMYPLLADRAIILAPRNMDFADLRGAIRRAKAIVGCEYDANFNFDLEESEEHIGPKVKYDRNLTAGAFHPAFSCTEVVGFSYYLAREKLRLFRSTYAGREAIMADDYLKMEFDVAWASPTVTAEWARRAGLHEEGVKKIEKYWREK